MDIRRKPGAPARRWTSLAGFLLVLLFAGAADGLMDKLGLGRFLAAGLAVLGAAWALGRCGARGGTENEQ